MTIRFILVFLLMCTAVSLGFAQVDTTYIYNNNAPYGSLDIRIATSPAAYYYLQDGKTFSFRENAGVRTDTYLDMTSSWDSSPYKQGNLRFTNGTSDNFVMNYRYLEPVGYTNAFSEGYPLLLILHGLGEAGNCQERDCYHADASWSPVTNNPPAPAGPAFELLNNDQQLTNGGRAHLKAVNDAGGKLPNDPSLMSRAFPGFVIFPQNLVGWGPTTAQDAIRIVRLFMKKYKINPDRVYIHGLSNGGQGVYETIKRAPWMFAAALTMSPISDGNINNQGVAGSIATIPQWIFQGGKDIRPLPAKTESMIRKFREVGAVIRYTLYPDLGHGTWGTAYTEPDFFQWILGKTNRKIHAFGGSTTICSGDGLRLELPAGFFAYQWQVNGQTIAGASGSSYTATTAGTYRARYSRVANPTEAQWNPWSDPMEVKAGTPLPPAEITQQGTVILRDLNGGNEARLISTKASDRYLWFRNGTRIDFAGDQDDTVRRPVITSTMGAGAYTLVNANYDNCQSPSSTPRQVFFNNAAPLNITAPTNFAGTISNGIEAKLTWTDASNNEEGFEIWRRRKINETTFTPWEFVTIAPANATTFTNSALPATTSYEFKIRGVSSTGRSDYAPGATGLSVTTITDSQPPSAPSDLKGVSVGVSKIRLSWSPSTDNGSIKDYIIKFDNDSIVTVNADTMYLMNDVPINEVLDISVRARDAAGNLSALSNTIEKTTYVAGLYYEHATGATEDLDTINWDLVEFFGTVPKVILSPKTQDDYFHFLFDGFIYINTAGSYQFRTGSDDGSRLIIEGNTVVENDGVHLFRKVESALINMETGAHRFKVLFFDYIQSDSLIAEYKGPDTNNEWREISAEAFKSSEQIVTGIGPDDGPEDSFKLHVYPNPVSGGRVNLKVETVNTSTVLVRMLDPIGKTFFLQEYDVSSLTSGVQLDLAGTLSPGIYFIIVNQENLTAKQRVVVRQ